MLVFIDESGCPGFKITKGSDPIFAIGMVVLTNTEDALVTENAIRDLHAWTGHKPEFKFSKCSNDVRDKFFAGVAALPFQVFAIVVRKDLIYSTALRTQTDKFYNYFLRLLIDGKVDLADARIRLDGSGGRDFERALKAYLRRESSIDIADFRMVDSSRDQLAQLADMCVGAIARCYRENRDDPKRWRTVIRKRIADVWEFK